MRIGRVIALFLAALAFAIAVGQRQVPTISGEESGLEVTYADRRLVRLKWVRMNNAPRYAVERAVLGAGFEEIGRTPADIFEDPGVLQPITYQYRVRSISAGGELGPPSNVVTVGPPPVGASVVAEAPINRVQDYVRSLSTVLDPNGDPCFGFVFSDPNGDLNPIDSQLLFVSWDRAKYRWREPVFVDRCLVLEDELHPWTLDIGVDQSTGEAGILYMRSETELWLATTVDPTKPWKKELVAGVEDDQYIRHPRLAMTTPVHAAYFHSKEGVKLGVRQLGGFAFAAPAGEKQITAGPIGLFAGPQLLYFANPSRVTMRLWAAAGLVSLPLSRLGVISAFVFRGDQYVGAFSKDGLDLVALKDGVWTAIKNPAPANATSPVSIAAGKTAISMTFAESRPGAGSVVVLVRSDEKAETWKRLTPSLAPMNPSKVYSPRLLVAENDGAYLAFVNADQQSRAKLGLTLWREK